MLLADKGNRPGFCRSSGSPLMFAFGQSTASPAAAILFILSILFAWISFLVHFNGAVALPEGKEFTQRGPVQAPDSRQPPIASTQRLQPVDFFGSLSFRQRGGGVDGRRQGGAIACRNAGAAFGLRRRAGVAAGQRRWVGQRDYALRADRRQAVIAKSGPGKPA
jgi:hypothetical protein